jgi:hypothetical protein
MTTRAFTGLPVFGRQPPYVTEIRHLGAGSEQHQHPLIDRVDEHDALSLRVLGDRLSRPGCRPFFLAVMDD